MIESTVTAYMCGKMAGSTRVAGRTASNTERACTSRLTAKNAEVYGKMASALSGSTNSDTSFKILLIGYIMLNKFTKTNIILCFNHS
jgi:hypothetical protein